MVMVKVVMMTMVLDSGGDDGHSVDIGGGDGGNGDVNSDDSGDGDNVIVMGIVVMVVMVSVLMMTMAAYSKCISHICSLNPNSISMYPLHTYNTWPNSFHSNPDLM